MMHLTKELLMILVASTILLSISCDSDIPIGNDGLPIDGDGNTYTTLILHNQTWFAENLRTTRFNDGTPIDEVTDNSTWSGLDVPGYSTYNNVTSNADNYGNLYNGYAVSQGNLCPKGWRVATDEDWKKLETVLGMTQEQSNSPFWRGTNEGSKLANFNQLWTNGVLVDNSSFGTIGFGATPGGYRGDDGEFYNLGTHSYWWTRTEDTPGFLWNRSIFNEDTRIARNASNLKNGYCVRCIRDF